MTGRAGRSPRRAFRLDGPAFRAGGPPLAGELADDDLSLTHDAAARVVTAHRAGEAEPVGDDVFAVLADRLAADAGDPTVLWVGWFGYACRPDLPARPAPSPVPDAVWLRARLDRPLPHGPATGAAASPESPESPGPHGPSGPPGPVPALPGARREEPVPDWYAAAFERVQAELHAGNTYEVNLTYRESLTTAVDPGTAYDRLRTLNPAPYAGSLRHGPVHLLSSSPERYASVGPAGPDGAARRVLEARPIKGTTPRSVDPAQDALQAERLRTDPKLRAENLMITDLLRNDLSMVCAPGTVQVPSLMEVEAHPSVHQLVTTVRGRLRPEVGTVGALRALFPAGSMTGAPKRRTMEVVDAVEASPRGAYSGAFGWVCGDGRAELAVVIRSLLGVEAADGSTRWEVGTGGGITVRSEVAEEWAETRWKVDRVLAAVRPEPS